MRIIGRPPAGARARLRPQPSATLHRRVHLELLRIERDAFEGIEGFDRRGEPVAEHLGEPFCPRGAPAEHDAIDAVRRRRWP